MSLITLKAIQDAAGLTNAQVGVLIGREISSVKKKRAGTVATTPAELSVVFFASRSPSVMACLKHVTYANTQAPAELVHVMLAELDRYTRLREGRQ